MRSSAETVEDYLAELDDDRRDAIEEVRDVIVANLPEGFVETMNWGMIAYEVPLATFPDTYNGQPLMLAALASQKRHMAVYLSAIYADPELDEWFRSDYSATGKRMDIGKSCVRFTSLDDLPLDLVGEAIAKVSVNEFIDLYGRR
ncbi:MAG: DUF1801 domain-containing protein [Acidimicrobiia bacterium]|nr:DUF1801 domain-containing protein [Acidimicrobiia bacterium]